MNESICYSKCTKNKFTRMQSPRTKPTTSHEICQPHCTKLVREFQGGVPVFLGFGTASGFSQTHDISKPVILKGKQVGIEPTTCGPSAHRPSLDALSLLNGAFYGGRWHLFSFCLFLSAGPDLHDVDVEGFASTFFGIQDCNTKQTYWIPVASQWPPLSFGVRLKFPEILVSGPQDPQTSLALLSQRLRFST